MRAIDTNVLVRLATRDDAKQVAAAEAFIIQIQSVARFLLASDNLQYCKSENHLRGLFIASFFESGCGSAHLCLVEHEDKYSRLDPNRDRKMRNIAIVDRKTLDIDKAIGEFKFYSRNANRNYHHPIAARLSDLHYLQDFAAVRNRLTFFLDVIFQPELVGVACYNSLKKMSAKAASLVSTGISIDQLVSQKGLKAYFRFAIDRTSRSEHRKYYGKYLFPCIDEDPAGKHLRGPVLVRKPDATTGLITIGVRRSKRKDVDKQEQTTPYMPLLKINGACCFAAFSPGGKMLLTTSDVV